MTEPEKKESSVGLRAAIGVGVIFALAIMAPIIWAAVSAGIGIVILGGVCAAGIGAVHMLPYLGQRWENKILSLHKEEARKHPVEQLQQFLLQKSRQVQEFRNAVAQIGGQIRSLEDMVRERKRTKPGYDSAKQELSIEAMRGAHAKLHEKYNAAEEALAQLKDSIEDTKFQFAANAAIQSLNETNGQELLDQMLADEAFSSVRDKFNTVFADLEIEATNLNNKQALTFDNGMSIDLSSIQIPISVSAMAKG